MKKIDIEEILIKDYKYKKSDLKNKNVEQLKKLLSKERENKNNFFSNFWKINEMPKPTIDDNFHPKSNKYAYIILIAWISMFLLLIVFMIIMIHFYA